MLRGGHGPGSGTPVPPWHGLTSRPRLLNGCGPGPRGHSVHSQSRSWEPPVGASQCAHHACPGPVSGPAKVTHVRFTGFIDGDRVGETPPHPPGSGRAEAPNGAEEPRPASRAPAADVGSRGPGGCGLGATSGQVGRGRQGPLGPWVLSKERPTCWERPKFSGFVFIARLVSRKMMMEEWASVSSRRPVGVGLMGTSLVLPRWHARPSEPGRRDRLSSPAAGISLLVPL